MPRGSNTEKMNNIRFRAWHEGKMIYNVTTSPNEDGEYCLITFATGGMYGWPCFTITPYPDSPVMLRVGLDGSGKDVYYGDIAKCSGNDLCEESLQEVKYVNGLCNVFFIETHDGFEPRPIEQIELVGNIYENPELLK